MAGHSVVQYIGFGLSADAEHTRESVAAITSYELFSADGRPVTGGGYDGRMGTIAHDYLCLTCVQGKKLCPGHPGHLSLRVAVSQPIGIAEIRRWLRVVCFKCGEIVVDREKYAGLPPGKRLAEAATVATEGKRCPRCGTVHPRVVKDDEDYFTFWAASPGSEKRGRAGRTPTEERGDKLYPDAIRAIFERVSDSAVEAMGRNVDIHPRKLVLRVIRVPPNTIRPGVKSYGGAGSSYHDSTNLLQHLIKRNSQLPERLPDAMGPLGPGGPVEGDLDRAIQNLQQLYYDMIYGSSSTSVTQGSSGRRGLVVGTRPVHSFLRNLPRKEGRIRANLLGKRVFYVSRSTISGNMQFRVDEVGMPLEFARKLQVEEDVQEYNLDALMIYFLNGRRQYPGCTLLRRRATGETHDVAGLRDVRLEIGDVLYRDVIDGDTAYFNRQPTLERSSIGVHRVIVIQDPSVHTFQMNVLACENYNADFDGDRQRVPQSHASREARNGSQAVNQQEKTWRNETATGGCVWLVTSGVRSERRAPPAGPRQGCGLQNLLQVAKRVKTVKDAIRGRDRRCSREGLRSARRTTRGGRPLCEIATDWVTRWQRKLLNVQSDRARQAVRKIRRPRSHRVVLNSARGQKPTSSTCRGKAERAATGTTTYKIPPLLQMNLWVARRPASRAEAMIMSPIANWFISTKTSGPVNGQVQDSTVGSNELTRSTVRIDKYHAMALFANAGVEPPRFDEKPADQVYTGRDIVSLLFAGTPVNYSRVPSSYSDVYAPILLYDPSETLTVMEQGRLVKGVLDKRSVGAKASGGLFHLVSREYGPQRALNMIFALQQIALQFLLYRGFTVATADLLPGKEALEQIRALVSRVLLESRVITGQLLRGEIIPPIDSTVHERYERLQINALKVSDSELFRWILSSIRPATNGFFRMVAVGSKGSNPNIAHVMGVIGQTTINGERIREQFSFRRTSPYFARFSIDPAAYGFVANSYMTGMRASEFIFQDMNGRFDLINKALSTASTGYFMRKGVMNNQSSIVDNHRRVTKDTKVVQYIYGEDGLDSRELEKVSFSTVPLSDTALRSAVWVDLEHAQQQTGSGFPAGPAAELDAAQGVVDQALATIQEDRDVFRRIFLRIEDSNFSPTFSTKLLMPVNVRRIVEGVFIAAKGTPLETPPLTASGLKERVERVRDLCARLPYALLNEIQERRRSPVPPHISAACALLCMLVRAELSPKVLVRLSDEQLTFVVDAIRQRYSLSLIGYGTAVGVLAAQSISEPLTQYMLDSHHRSVAGGTNKSGLIRVGEIYGAKPVSEEQSAAMMLPLKASALGASADAYGIAQEIANSIEYVTLRRFTRQHDTLLEPYTALVFPPFTGDRVWIEEFERAHPLVRPPGDLTNWCFRFALDKSALVLKAVDLELVVRRLRARHPGTYVVHTPEAVPEIVIRVWLRATQFKSSGDEEDRSRDLVEEILDTPVRGISGIMRASAERVPRHHIGADGALVKEDRYVISTVGTNLYSAILHSAVDTTRAISTSIGDTEKLFGIEAARAKIVSETRSFMEDRTPNLRHLYLYADEMTRTGRVTSIERGGLGSREHNNVLLRMAYGAPIQVVTDATLASARSRIYGIAAPQMLGSIPQIGSLYNTLLVDEEFVKENVRSVDSILDAI